MFMGKEVWTQISFLFWKK